MKTLTYLKQRNPKETRSLSLKDFVEASKDAIMLENTGVLLILEPGDGTHYELVAATLPDGRVMWAQLNDSGGWACHMSPDCVHINYFLEKAGKNANPWTVHMVCELHNMIFGIPTSCYIPDKYYDFAKAEVRRE